jgi:hypothetical protein
VRRWSLSSRSTSTAACVDVAPGTFRRRFGALRRPHDDPFPWIGKPHVFFVGRLAPQKGMRTLATVALLPESPRAQIQRDGLRLV